MPIILAKNQGGYCVGGNSYKLVIQLEIVGCEKCIPDGILCIDDLFLVPFNHASTVHLKDIREGGELKREGTVAKFATV